jgi:hypothetical protein
LLLAQAEMSLQRRRGPAGSGVWWPRTAALRAPPAAICRSGWGAVNCILNIRRLYWRAGLAASLR